MAEEGGRIVGAIGLEVYGDCGLLRSAVVDAERRGSGLGSDLVERLLLRAETRGDPRDLPADHDGRALLPRFGFAAIARDEVAAPVRASEEFRVPVRIPRSRCDGSRGLDERVVSGAVSLYRELRSEPDRARRCSSTTGQGGSRRRAPARSRRRRSNPGAIEALAAAGIRWARPSTAAGGGGGASALGSRRHRVRRCQGVVPGLSCRPDHRALGDARSGGGEGRRRDQACRVSRTRLPCCAGGWGRWSQLPVEELPRAELERRIRSIGEIAVNPGRGRYQRLSSDRYVARRRLRRSGAWRSPVARLLWEQEVPGSNPGAPMVEYGSPELYDPPMRL